MRQPDRRQTIRRATLLSIVTLSLCALLLPGAGRRAARAALASHLVISEIQISGDGGADDEFVELHNPTNAPVVMIGWRLSRKTSTGGDANLVPNLNGTIPAGGFFLIAHPGYNGGATPDVVYALSNRLAADNTVLLYSDSGLTLVDKVGFGAATSPEGSAFPVNPPPEASLERKPGAADPLGGNGQDTDDNAEDFALRAASEPQNSSSPVEMPAAPTPAGLDTATSTASPTSTPSPSGTGTPTSTATASGTPTPTATPTATASRTPAAQYIVVNEVVTDPQHDWSDSAGGDGVPFNQVPGSGPITDSDEWVELYNAGADPVDLLAGGGWTLSMTDSGTDVLNFRSPGTAVFVFSRCGSLARFQPGEYLIIGNPPGAMNNTVHLALRDPSGAEVDSAQLGAGGAPDGNATGPLDEAVARAPDAADTGLDSADFAKQAASPGGPNTPPIPAAPTAFPPCPPTATPTPTNTWTPTPTATPFPARAVVVNEVMWMGSHADADDEWIELYNTTGGPIDLAGWTLTIDDGLPPEDTVINLRGVIPPFGYFLLERTDDTTVSDIAADLIYAGALSNAGRILNLRDPSFTSIDTANRDGGPWPAGGEANRASMERISALAPDEDGNWSANYGHVTSGLDRDGRPLRATPRQPNSNLVSTPTPTAFVRYTSVRLNEVLVNPGSSADWAEYGLTHTPDEYVELYNSGDQPVDIGYWMIDDQVGGSAPHVLGPGTIIEPGQFWFIYGRDLKISFNDDGDSARLLYPDGSVVDEVSWAKPMKDDRSISREVSGTGAWQYDWQPTPGMPNHPHAVGSRYGPRPTPAIVGIRAALTFDDGAWVTLVGRVTGPHPLFGSRVIYMQDESGRGIAVYLGRGTWPPMALGQAITAAGYLRTRNGERELYVRNAWLFSLGQPGPAPTPAPVRTGEIGDQTEGALVTIRGKVVRLESNAFWIDDGSGPARIFFRSSAGISRPKVRRGQLWQATGIVGEFTTRASRARGHRVMVRYEMDVFRITGEGVPFDLTPTATALPDESATPTLIPEETPTP